MLGPGLLMTGPSNVDVFFRHFALLCQLDLYVNRQVHRLQKLSRAGGIICLLTHSCMSVALNIITHPQLTHELVTIARGTAHHLLQEKLFRFLQIVARFKFSARLFHELTILPAGRQLPQDQDGQRSTDLDETLWFRRHTSSIYSTGRICTPEYPRATLIGGMPTDTVILNVGYCPCNTCVFL